MSFIKFKLALKELSIILLKNNSSFLSNSSKFNVIFLREDNFNSFFFAISFKLKPSKISWEILFSKSIRKLLTSLLKIVLIISSFTSLKDNCLSGSILFNKII